MKSFISTHPIFTMSQCLIDICKPLESFGITYFCHVNISKNGVFTSLSNNPKFAEHYLKNKYYNADIHLAKTESLGSYVLWDMIDIRGESEKLRCEAIAFGVDHTFTIVENNSHSQDFYHFSTRLACKTINQFYITHMDLLKLFILNFKEKVLQSKELQEAYQIHFKIDDDAEGYHLYLVEELEEIAVKRNKFIEALQFSSLKAGTASNIFKQKIGTILHKDTHLPLSLSSQQYKCLQLLMSGYKPKQIAQMLQLSHRTVEHYLAKIRVTLGCKSSNEIITAYYQQLI